MELLNFFKQLKKYLLLYFLSSLNSLKNMFYCILSIFIQIVTLCSFNLRASQVVLEVKNPTANAGDIRDVGSIPGSGRSLVGGHVNRLQNSCLENTKDRGDWQATVHRVTKDRTQLKQLSTHAHTKFQFTQNIYKFRTKQKGLPYKAEIAVIRDYVLVITVFRYYAKFSFRVYYAYNLNHLIS